MAVATSTALAIGSVAASGASAIMSFNQALKANNLQKQAQRDAENAMQEAKKILGVNYMAGLSIQKEPYELEREALLAQGAQAIQAGVESERGSAATAGRVQEQMNLAQAAQRIAMQQELSNLEKLKAEGDKDVAEKLGSLALSEAEGQQTIAREAAKEKAAAIQSGIASATSALKTGIGEFVPLYGKGSKTKTNVVDNAANVAAPTQTASLAGQGQVPSSKLNISNFQTMPSTQNMLENNLQTNMQYGTGSKLGSPLLVPSWEDAANFFKFY